MTVTRNLTILEVKLSLEDEDKNHIGYIAPLPHDQVREVTLEDLEKGRERRGGDRRSGDRRGGYRGDRGANRRGESQRERGEGSY